MDANSILQSYNKATGSSSTPQYKPTGKPKVDSILQSYYTASAKAKVAPTVTPAPKKVATTPVKKVAATPIVKQAPQTGVQKALKTLGDVSQQAQNVVKTIGKGIEVTFVKPKVISPVPEKVLQQKKQQAQGPVQIKPGQTKLTKTQMSGFAQMTNNITSQIPATIKSAKEYAKDPLNIGKLNNKGQAESRKAAAEGFNDIKSAFVEAVNRSVKAQQKAPLGEKIVRKAESVTGVVNLLFSPIGATFKVANTIPIVSAVTKALSLPFEALGEGVPKITNSAVDSLPVSKKTKARIKPVVAEATTIVAMLALGKATEIGGEKLKSTIKTVGADNFERLTKNVIETSGSAKTYNLTRDQVRDIYRGLGDKDAVDAFKQLGVEDRIKAVKEGVTLDIPTEKIVRIVDKPYWEKIKTILGKELTNKEVITKGAATGRPGFAGYLTDGQHTPQEVVGAVIKAAEENTVEGKATIKAALEAQQSGHNIEIKQVEEKPKDPYVYHETKNSNLDSIAKNGLQKSPGQYGNAVYTAGTISETKGYGSEGDTILRIKRDNLPSDFQEFPEQGWTTKTISPQYLEVSKDNGKTWQSLQEQKIPQIERAKDYTSAKDFATEVYSARPENQIGLVDPNTITIRDNVDPKSPEYIKLKGDIEKNGIKEPIRVTVDGKPLTTDGSNRTSIARELGIKVPVIVNKGEIKGLRTIDQTYNEQNRKELTVYRTEKAHAAYKGKAVWGDGKYYGLDKNQVAEMTTDPNATVKGEVPDMKSVKTIKIPAGTKLKEYDIDKMSNAEFDRMPKGNDLKKQVLSEGYDGVIIKTGGDLNYGGDQVVLYNQERTALEHSAEAKAGLKKAMEPAESQEDSVKLAEGYIQPRIDRLKENFSLNELKGLRAAINREMYNIAGVDPRNGKSEIKIFDEAFSNPEMSDILEKLDSYVKKIDKILESKGEQASNKKQAKITIDNKVKELSAAEKYVQSKDAKLRTDQKHFQFHKISIKQLHDIDPTGLQQTAADVSKGLKSTTKGPVDVVATGDGYLLLDGNHRTLEAKLAGKDTIDAYILSTKEALAKYGEIYPQLKFVLDASPSEDAKLRIRDDLAKKGIKITLAQQAEIEALNKKIFGDEDVKITGQIIANQAALGKYEKGMIEILDGQADPKDTFYHEAVHKYLDVFTDQADHVAILEEGAKKYGTEDYAQVEEKIAEDFINYAKSKEGFVGKLKGLIDKLIQQIKTYFGNKSKIDEMYREIIEKGKTRPGEREVQVSRDQIPIGEGRTRATRLEARVQDIKGNLEKVSQETIDKMKLSTYEELNNKEQIRKAVEWADQHREEAIQVLTGEIPAPPGILRNAIYVAMQNEAIGDVALARKLASLQSTRYGQEIQVLSEIDPDSPVKIMTDIVRIREEQFKKKYGNRKPSQVKEKIVRDIKAKVKAPDKYDWNAFINSIDTC